MRSFALAWPLAAAITLGACSKTPHFGPGASGGAGGGGSSTSTQPGSGGSGGARACAVAADCGMEGACAHPACEDGACAQVFEPAGTAVAAQVPGDCRQVVCDGQGFTKSATAPGDAPNDGNDCTADSCSGATPVHEFLPAGTPCGTAANLTCNGQGVCLGCNKSQDCGPGGECFSWKCVSQSCHQVFVPAGSGSPAGDVPYDCQRPRCDGSGGVRIYDDPGDAPGNPSDCVWGACANGSPTTEAAPAGTSCSGGLCDGGGSCVGCLSDGDCGSPSACQTPACDGQACHSVSTALGTPTAQQTAGDCRQVICDGQGGLTDQADDTDKPAPPDPCHGATCVNGQPSFPAITLPSTGNPCTQNVCDATGIHAVPVTDGTMCAPCSVCLGGTCVDTCSGCTCYSYGCDCGGGGG